MKLLSKLSKKEKLGLFAAVAAVSLVLFDRVLISPINDKFRRINGDINVAEKQLGRDLRNLNQKDDIAKEFRKYSQYVKKTSSDDEEVAKILAEVESLARKSQVTLADIKPQAPKQSDFYKIYTIDVEAEGVIEAITSFLRELSGSKLLLRAARTRLNPKDKESSAIKASISVTRVLMP